MDEVGVLAAIFLPKQAFLVYWTADRIGTRGRMTYFPETLVDRYKRFKFRHFAPNQDHYETLASEGQSPEIMIVSVSLSCGGEPNSNCSPRMISS